MGGRQLVSAEAQPHPKMVAAIPGGSSAAGRAVRLAGVSFAH